MGALGSLQLKDILSPTVSAMALIVSLSSFWFARRSAVLSRKPVLIFQYDGAVGWVLKNVGSGPALNAVVAQKYVKEGVKASYWFNPVRVPPLAKDGEMVLTWLGHDNSTGLGATYSDFVGKAYTSTCGDDHNKIFEGFLFGPWKVVGRHWNQPPYVEPL